MTHSELRWAQSQSWWNDFTNIYKRLAKNINFETYIEKVSLEMVPIYLIGDANLNDTDNIILIRIANACLDHMEDLPGLGEHSKPVIRTYKKEEKPSKKGFSYSSKKEEMAVVYLSNKVSEDEIQEIHSAIIERGIDFDEIKPSEKTIRYFKTIKVLKEI